MLGYIRHLSPDSPLGIAINGEAAHWGIAEHLAATQIDMIAAGNWQRGGGKGPRPKPLKRPDPRAEKRRREYVGRLQRLGLIKTGG